MFLRHEKGATALTPRVCPSSTNSWPAATSGFVDSEYYVNGRGSFSGKQGLPAHPPPKGQTVTISGFGRGHGFLFKVLDSATVRRVATDNTYRNRHGCAPLDTTGSRPALASRPRSVNS